MGMHSLIEDARQKAMDAANCWHETPQAKALLEKIDAYERQSDCWSGECGQVSEAFNEAARDAEDELEQLRYDAINAAADTYSANRNSDEWLEAFLAADTDAPPVKQAIDQARRNHAGNGYLERLVA